MQRRYYDKKTRRWSRRAPKVPCVELLDYPFRAASSDKPSALVHCFSILSNPGGQPKKGAKSAYPWVIHSPGDSDVRHRSLSTKGGIDLVTYTRVGSVDIHPTYTKAYIVQPQLVVDEYASAIIVGKHTDWNPFQHYVRRMEPAMLFPFSYAHRFYAPDHDDTLSSHHVGVHSDPFWGVRWGSGSSGDYDAILDGLPEFRVPNYEGEGFIPLPEQLTELTVASLNAMLPRVRAELSGINSLIELKDFSHFPATLSRIAHGCDHLARLQFKVLRESASRLGWRGLLKQSAGDFLEWKFNVAPFISDVKAVMHSLETCKARIFRLLKAQAVPQHRHYSRSFREFPYLTDETQVKTVFIDPDILSTSVRRVSRTDESKFHAEVEYLYVYSAFQVEFAQLLGLLDMVGVNLNPATIWRAIPYTWLIDFVVHVGRWLDRLKLRNMDPTLRVDRYLWSILRRRRTDCLLVRQSNYPPNANVFVPGSTVMPTVQETSYGRFTTLPDMTSFTTSEVTSDEFTLASALAISRMRRTARSRIRAASPWRNKIPPLTLLSTSRGTRQNRRARAVLLSVLGS